MSENNSFTVENINSMKVVDLRQELDKRGLEKSGLKADLVKRLEQSLLDDSSELNDTDDILEETGEKSEDFQMESQENADLQDIEEEVNAEQQIELMKANEQHQSGQVKKTEETQEEQSKEKVSEENGYSLVDNKIEVQSTEGKEKEEEIMQETTNKLSHKLPDEEGMLSMEQAAVVAIKDTLSPEKEAVNNQNLASGKEETVDSLENASDLLTKDNDDDLDYQDEKDSISIGGENTIEDVQELEASDENLNKNGRSTLIDNEDTKGLDKGFEQNSNSEIVKSDKNEKCVDDKKDSIVKSPAAKSSNDEKKKDLSKCLWISGLSSITKALDLKDLCSKCGKVVGAKVVTSAKTPGSQCFGFVTMSTAEEAQLCIETLHKCTLHDNVLSVERAKTDPTPAKKPLLEQSRTEKRSDHQRPTKSPHSSFQSSYRRDEFNRRDDRWFRRNRGHVHEKRSIHRNNSVGIENDALSESKRSDEERKSEESTKSLELLRQERAEKIKKEKKNREERRQRERERERLLREEQRIEQERREKERRERARKEAERVRREREKQRELEKQREKERERERERFLRERKEREDRERRERERERDQLERERMERERIERERKERERLENERKERERQEKERLEKERLARLERENRIEKERQRLEEERLSRERHERERHRMIDRGIDRGLGSSNPMKRSLHDEREYYQESKRSAHKESPSFNRKDFFNVGNRESYIKNDQYTHDRRSNNSGAMRAEVRSKDARFNTAGRYDERRNDFRRDDHRKDSNTSSDIRRVVPRDDRPYERERSPHRSADRMQRDGDKRDWLDVQITSAPKTLSDVLGRAGLTGILGKTNENKAYDVRSNTGFDSSNRHYSQRDYSFRDEGRSESRSVRDERRSRDDLRQDSRGSRHEEKRRDDGKGRHASPSYGRNRTDDRSIRHHDSSRGSMSSRPEISQSLTNRRSLHSLAGDLGGLTMMQPGIVPLTDMFGRPLQQVQGASAALQAGYVAAAHGLALHQAAQGNLQVRDGRIEYTQQVRHPQNIIPTVRRF